MRRLMFAAVLLAGCAMVAPPVMQTPAPTTASAPTCVPPGMPAFADWKPLPGGQMGTIRSDATGEQQFAMIQLYSVAGRPVSRMVTRGVGTVAVDPAPDDPEVAVWYDAGLVRIAEHDEEGHPVFALLAEPGPRCQWRQAGATTQL